MIILISIVTSICCALTCFFLYKGSAKNQIEQLRKLKKECDKHSELEELGKDVDYILNYFNNDV